MHVSIWKLFFAVCLSCSVVATRPVLATSEPGDPNEKPLSQPAIDPVITEGDVPTKANTQFYPSPAPRSVREPAVSTVSQPTGVLSGRIVFTNPGHGWQYSSTLGRWATDRGINNQIVEDFGNLDQFNFYVNYLFNAGATVVPFRPVGNQTNEVILDNDDAAVSFAGTWSNSTSSQFYGQAGDAVSYRFAVTALSETAVATYRPNIPQPGFYPVYTWVLNSSNRSADQLYRVIHSGGVSEVRVNHIRVGRGWVYLGTYYLEAGNAAYVEISNQSSTAGTNVIADAIRFGNGMGDVVDGTGISGFPREDEGNIYWLYRALGQGGDNTIYTAGNVNGPPKMAAYMNNQASGAITDRLYIGIHSNAGGGRGARGLINDNQSVWTTTPHQTELASIMGSEVNNDMRAVNSLLPATWYTGSTNTFTSKFGEMRNDLINGEMDDIICEVAFHDDSSDAAIMRDPDGRKLIARAMLHGTIKYFSQLGGGQAIFPPNPPIRVKAVSLGDGSVNVSWMAPPTDPAGSGAPSGYVVYRSSNGYGFGDPIVVNGSTQAIIPGLSDGSVVYLRVASRNGAGESFPSETMAVRVSTTSTNPVLIVNGFDRVDAATNVRETRANLGTYDRVKPWKSNNFDYAVQHAKALAAAGRYFDSASNEVLSSVLLDGYQALVWIAGEESTADETFSAIEQTMVQNFLVSGKSLMVSGAEIGWDLEAQAGGAGFYNGTLLSDYVANDAGTYNVQAGTGIFAGVSAFNFGPGSSINNTVYPPNGNAPYDAEAPDTLNPLGGSTTVLTYSNGAGAAVASNVSGVKIVSLGFPFECITSDPARTGIMQATMNYFGVGSSAVNDWALY